MTRQCLAFSKAWLPSRRQKSQIKEETNTNQPWYHCHARPVNQNWNDTDVPLERGRDFDRHEIIRIVEPASAALILRVQPIRSNDDEKSVARSHLVVQVCRKIDAGRNVVDIHENLVAA